MGLHKDTATTKKRKKKSLAAKQRVTANQLGFRICTLVYYKQNPYHIVCVDETGTILTIKKCENANKLRDVHFSKLKLVEPSDPIFKKWNVAVPNSFNRTKEQELFLIKALVDSTRGQGKEARRDVLVDMLEKHSWLGVWLRACYDQDREYRLKPKHIKHERIVAIPPEPTEYGIFVLLTKLQFNKLSPIKAATLWRNMLLEWDEEVRAIANMVLRRQFGDLTYEDVRYAMKKTKNHPILPKRDLGE